MTTLEAQASKKLKDKLYQITIKYSKLVESTKKDLDAKKDKEMKKAERQVKQRLINQQKKEKNKLRAKEGKPLLKVKTKKVNRVKKCDDLFSKYIRLKYGNVCYTCWGTDHIGNGHCVSRKIRKLRRDEDNCRPQCFYICNAKFSGNGETTKFKKKLTTHGVNVLYLEEQELLAKWPLGNKKPNAKELQEIYERIKSDYDKLIATKKYVE